MRGVGLGRVVSAAPAPLAQIRERVWARVQLARNPRRPHSLELIGHLADSFVEVSKAKRVLDWAPQDIKNMIEFQHAFDRELQQNGEMVFNAGLSWPEQARIVRYEDAPDAADLAVTVKDDWQGRGVATVLLEAREGPAGWRSVVASPAGGELAFWQRKR